MRVPTTKDAYHPIKEYRGPWGVSWVMPYFRLITLIHAKKDSGSYEYESMYRMIPHSSDDSSLPTPYDTRPWVSYLADDTKTDHIIR